MQTGTARQEMPPAANVTDIHRLRPDLEAPHGDSTLARLYEEVLEQLDYGVACVDETGRLIHANHLAQREWPLLRASGGGPLSAAIRAASTQGTRRLVEVKRTGDPLQVAVMPLLQRALGGRPVVLILGKSAVCERLSSYWYGLARGLSGTEQSVLDELAQGWSPREIAQRHRVSLSTVRTQIASVRAKTASDGIPALLRHVAQLPPIRCTAG